MQVLWAVAFEWSERAEERLIHFIKDYSWLYDCKHQSYKDKHKKRNSWMELARLFGDGVDGMYQWYTYFCVRITITYIQS